jgi:choline dehydrogenase-like flavoprotein
LCQPYRSLGGIDRFLARQGLDHRQIVEKNSATLQSTHIQGGAIMGRSPDCSVVNPYMQHWQVPNLFVLGASGFPQNASANPTPTILALTYRTADAIVNRYLKNPAALA